MRKELSEDEISEILARLPVKSLMRFKRVSKLWYSLILSPNFISMHTTHNHYKNNQVSLWIYSFVCIGGDNPTTTISFRFGDVTGTHELTFSSLMGSVEIVGCFNGVVCLNLSVRPQKYALWNPATRKVREIGDPPMNGPDLDDGSDPALTRNGGWYGSGFCFDPATNAFKVAQMKLIFTQGVEQTRVQVNVFSTASNSWMEKNILVPFQILGSGHNVIHCATCVNGYMYWQISIFHHGREVVDKYILSYDMIDEVFKRIEMPIKIGILSQAIYHLAAYKGSLAIFVPRRTEIDVWVLTDFRGSNWSWSKILTFRPSIKVLHAYGFVRKNHDVDMILLREYPSWDSYLYDPENGETKKSQHMETFLYSESLASLN